MGILRVDKISGLETPTTVTGSVLFDGTGDYLDITVPVISNSNFTFEVWTYISSPASWNTVFEYGTHNSSDDGILLSFKGSGVNGVFARVGSTDISNATITAPYPIQLSQWNHLALTREGTTARLHLNGQFIGSATWSKDFTSTDLRIASARYLSGEAFPGYMSNFRVLKGTALYDGSDFTPPIHALEVIKDTVLLCCNNPDSAGAASLAGIGTAHTITVNGDAAASTFSPTLTRDFTDGTEFEGVTTFDTQGYFVPPSGTTTDRDRTGGRGLIRMADNGINYITISSLGNSQDFGDATVAAQNTSACASSTRGLFSQGYNAPLYYKTIDFVTIATTGNAKDFGDITTSASYIYGMGGCASSTRGLFAGGFTSPSPNAAAGLKQINYVTIASLGDSQDFGDLTGNGVRYPAATSSPTRGVFAGGRDSADAPVYNQNVIHYVTIASLGNAEDFGDLTYSPYAAMGTGSSTRGIFTGGYNPAGSAAYNNIEYVTISTTGNTQDFGDLTVARGGSAASSNPTRATFAGGNSVPANTNHIDYIAITSTGNALNFGDLISTMSAGCGCSNSHGGIS